MDRITAIRQSLTAFVCGLVGLLPIIGLVPAVHALGCWNRVRRKYGTQWNPADRYLSWGALLGTVGVLVSALLVACAMVVLTI